MSKTDWIVTAVVGLVFIGACTVVGWIVWALREIAGV